MGETYKGKDRRTHSMKGNKEGGLSEEKDGMGRQRQGSGRGNSKQV